MSTVEFTSLAFINTDGLRATGPAVSNAIQNVGLVKTSDTGQVNWSTVNAPGSANTAAGYEIFRFNDSLQASKPIFIKLEHGTGSGGPGLYALFITIGTGSDGAGNITGILLARTQYANNNYNASVYYPCRITGSTNRLLISLWSTSYNLLLNIERTHNSSGGDTDEGVIFHWSTNNSASGCEYLPFVGTLGTMYAKWNATLPPTGTGAIGNDIKLFPVRAWGPQETNPSVHLFLYFNDDLTAMTAVTATLWDGSTVTIVPLGMSHTAFYYGGVGYLALRAD